MSSGPTLGQVKAMMRDRGVRRLLVKFLSPNDNSKNQIYLGGDLSVVNVIPAGDPVAATSGSANEPIFKAPLSLSWLDDEGRGFPAPHSQLILYPQYPEVRFSGFLRAALWAPAELMRVRDAGRVLLFGIVPTGEIFAFAAAPTSLVASELRAISGAEEIGVFKVVSLDEGRVFGDSRSRLLAELCRISNKGWIQGWRLGPDGSGSPCKGTNCIGVTLESELGIVSNGRAEPDFEGWEVKGHTVASLDRPGSGPITLFTPEPTGGFYKTHGPVEFVLKYGYRDKNGRADRMNFGGIHRVGEKHASTGLTLTLQGYEPESQTLVRSNGELALVDGRGAIAASWNFVGLLAHWQKKHSRAAYVPGIRRTEPTAEFQYGLRVRLAAGTDYLRLLDSLARGIIYYDPGIKVENLSTKPVSKRRSQFRIASKHLGSLYHASSTETSCTDA